MVILREKKEPDFYQALIFFILYYKPQFSIAYVFTVQCPADDRARLFPNF